MGHGLLNTKREGTKSQVFACLANNNQNLGMEISDIRRARLKKFFEGKSLGEEKSYLSQLINSHGSFGEKAARRLEKTYGMGDKYLDQPLDGVKESKPVAVAEQADSIDADELLELITLYRQATKNGRSQILDSAREAPKTKRRRVLSAIHKS